ncbi:MAG: universal stress protein [Flavobacteriia bacterium]|nr:universal stress protein [Flavobacteriia bacterium]
MKQKTFIVPHDFTNAADVALEHAIATAKIVGTIIQLLHVVNNEQDIDAATVKLNAVIAKFSNRGVELLANIRIGNIFDDIADFAAEKQAQLIFMGTHGAHGWQHIVGSNALKIVTQSNVPFIIVQEKSVKPTGYDAIVVPMDLYKETMQKLSIVANLAKYFNSKVFVVTPSETDSYLKHQLESNILFAEKFFKNLNIEMISAVLPSSGFDKEVVKHAVSVDADLIAIMNLNRNSFLNVISSNYEQYMITNDALIPTLIVNPIESNTVYGAWFD